MVHNFNGDLDEDLCGLCTTVSVWICLFLNDLVKQGEEIVVM